MSRRKKPEENAVFKYPERFKEYSEKAAGLSYEELHSQDEMLRLLYAYMFWIKDPNREETDGVPTYESVIDTTREIRNLQRDHLNMLDRRSKIIIQEIIETAANYMTPEDWPKFKRAIKGIRSKMNKADAETDSEDGTEA